MNQETLVITESDAAGNADALADIALNSLGLILIILLIYIISFQDTKQKISSSQTSQKSTLSAQLERIDDLKNENKSVHQKIKTATELEKENEASRKRGKELVGLWKFEIRVQRLVDERGHVKRCDWIVDYLAFLEFDGGSISGTMFGARDRKKGTDTFQTASFAEIEGKIGPDNNVRIDFTFPSQGESLGVERIVGEMTSTKRIEGELLSVKVRRNFQNYEGRVIATKMTKTDLSGK